MRVLIINTDYPAFLAEFHRRIGLSDGAGYKGLMKARNDSLFGVADFYSRGFCDLGHVAWEVHANNGPMQISWMNEHGIPLKRHPHPSSLQRLIARLTGRHRDRPTTLVSPIGDRSADLADILICQVEVLKPQVVLNQAMSEVGTDIMRRIRKHVPLIVGQIASPLPDEADYSAYDMIVSSLPNYVEFFRDRGVSAELNRLAFDAAVLDKVRPAERDIPVSFVGSLTHKHRSRIELMESLAKQTDIRIWGGGVESVPPESPIVARHQGEAWGSRMFELLARSRITINHHIGIATDYANNMRLYEATGMGALLITDWKSNIAEMFEPGKEVVCYHDANECAELISYYLEHEDERARIAAAGQHRTLRDHTYRLRTGELAALFEKRMARH